MKQYLLSIICLGALVFAGCSDDDDDENKAFDEALKASITTYSNIVTANYEDARDDAMLLKTAVDGFVANPSATTQTAAKTAWLAARESYGQTEAFRFYGGPIDDEDGPEGQLNAWPLDESFIDYVSGTTNGDDPSSNENMINNPTKFPTITKALIADQNENGGETNVSSGFHAVEFLLWGQDASIGAGGGERSYTDYLTDGNGTNENQARRATYLTEATQLIVDDLDALITEWSTFSTSFTSDAELNNSLEKILTGIGKLSKGELAGERMFTAWDLRSKENEHSCFSDNTHRDIVTNAKGIQNVYLGSYERTNGTTISGTGFHDLLALQNATLAAEIKALMASSVASTEEIQAPFDQEFLDATGRVRIKSAIDLLRSQGDKIAEAAAEFGFTLDPSDV